MLAPAVWRNGDRRRYVRRADVLRRKLLQMEADEGDVDDGTADDSDVRTDERHPPITVVCAIWYGNDRNQVSFLLLVSSYTW